MNRPTKAILERLGADGLTRVLADLLDQPRLVELANACGLKYRGMRTKSQSRPRLLSDLAEKAGREEDAGKKVLRALERATAQASRDFTALAPEEKRRRLSDQELAAANGDVGLWLYLLAHPDEPADVEPAVRQSAFASLLSAAGNGAAERAAGPRTSAPRNETRLRRLIEERDRKLRHLEGQLARARELQKTTKQDLIQRKGELAESRMLAERLRDELARAQAQTSDRTESAPPRDKAPAELAKAVRQLVAEQKRLAHLLTPPAEERRPRREERGQGRLIELLEQTERRAAADSGERDRRLDLLAQGLEALREELHKRVGQVTVGAARRARPRGAAQRVGVFIDVQNCYYGARRLKGKLDFDALVAGAVRERRNIKTVAYIVESTEIDQSQFIAMLEKRGIEVRRKTLQVRADGSMKGDWDMELALDILDAAPGLDVVVLVSGDGDFTSLVTRVKSMGPRVEVMAFPRNAAKSLVRAADSFEPLDRRFMIYQRPAKPGEDEVVPAPPPAADEKAAPPAEAD